jgi:hypothetical protein
VPLPVLTSQNRDIAKRRLLLQKRLIQAD